jgi:protein-disulfide isomerase
LVWAFVLQRRAASADYVWRIPPVAVDDWQIYSSEGHRIGPADARVTIVAFADYRCASCSVLRGALASVLERHPLDVALVLRHYPLMALSDSAAIAAECAADEGLFFELHDLLFDTQAAIGTKSWASYAIDVGIKDAIGFQECMSNGAGLARVERDKFAGENAGVAGTPTLLVNGLMVTGNVDAEVIQELVNAALMGKSGLELMSGDRKRAR